MRSSCDLASSKRNPCVCSLRSRTEYADGMLNFRCGCQQRRNTRGSQSVIMVSLLFNRLNVEDVCCGTCRVFFCCCWLSCLVVVSYSSPKLRKESLRRKLCTRSAGRLLTSHEKRSDWKGKKGQRRCLDTKETLSSFGKSNSKPAMVQVLKPYPVET